MNILLVDDHEVVRRGLRQMLAEELEGVEFGEASNAPEAVEQVRHGDWDLVILDINLPGRSGLEVLREFGTLDPSLPVLVLSMVPEEQYAVRALRKGARGYLSKQRVAADLLAGVREILAGGYYIPAELAGRLVTELVVEPGAKLHHRLSDRELQVLTLIAQGRRIKAIAEQLSLSEKTIFTYRERLRDKLNLHTDVELVRYALKHQLID